MKQYQVIYRGKVIDVVTANDYWEAVIKADKLGYIITRVDVIEKSQGESNSR